MTWPFSSLGSTLMPISILSDTPPSPNLYLPLVQQSQQPTEINDCSFDLVVALAAKGFVILTGQSGTGKSRSALRLAQGFDSLDEFDNGIRGSSHELVPVGADWTDARPLVGYVNPFGAERKTASEESTHVTYEVPDALRLMLRAASPSNVGIPGILILDEMNLSHVERYFSPFLSLIEANRSSNGDASVPLLAADKIALIAEVLAASEPNSAESIAATELVANSRGLPVPLNLMVVGTVNVDETTYMFSPKVLDRAHVMEVHSIQPKQYFSNEVDPEPTIPIRSALDLLTWSIESRGSGIFDQHPTDMFDVAKEIAPEKVDTIDAISKATVSLLDGAYTLLDPVGFGFGFRAINEVCAYMLAWVKAKSLVGEDLQGWETALDKAFFQKILPKIHGNRRQLGESLLALDAFLSGKDENSSPPAKYRIGTSEPIGISTSSALVLNVSNAMARSRAKLNTMQIQLQSTGYATFIR
jgi:5-methylcytosine-specific restriction endonuclease McrBC GTP-binding regulatory subunit McrB